VNKSSKMRLAGHVARTGERAGATVFRWGNLKERYNFWDLGVERSIISNLILKTWNGRHGIYWA